MFPSLLSVVIVVCYTLLVLLVLFVRFRRFEHIRVALLRLRQFLIRSYIIVVGASIFILLLLKDIEAILGALTGLLTAQLTNIIIQSRKIQPQHNYAY